MWLTLYLVVTATTFVLSADDLKIETDGEQSRKILGSSVVTSVSVIMDTGNGSKAVFTDAVGKPIGKPSTSSDLASPINLLNPDRYEFYTFDNNGDLIKRLMSLDEIQGIIATGDSDGYDWDDFTSQGYLPEKKVNDVVNNVQNVLKEEMETHKNIPDTTMFDTPDVSDSWSMILPAVFGNSGEDIKPEKPITHVTPDTIMIEPDMQHTYIMSTPSKIKISSTASPQIVSVTTPRSPVSTPKSAVKVTTPNTYTQSKSTISSTLKPLSDSDLISSKIPLTYSTQPGISSSYKPQYSSSRLPVQTTPAQITFTSLSSKETISNTTEKVSSATPVKEKNPPMLNVEVYSNSKSTTEEPLHQFNDAFSHVVGNLPIDKDKGKPVYGMKVTFNPPTPTSTSSKPSTTNEIKISTKPTSIPTLTDFSSYSNKLNTFVPSSLGSTLSTTAKVQTTTIKPTRIPSTSTKAPLLVRIPTTEQIPVLTKLTTTMPISTWRPKLTTITTEAITTEDVPLSTWRPNLGNKEETEKGPNQLPTLSELLGLNKNDNTEDNDKLEVHAIIFEDKSTTERLQTTNSDEDLATLGSSYFGQKVTNLPTTQSSIINPFKPNENKSATTILDQLLYTTNIFEINTELAEKTTVAGLEVEHDHKENNDVKFESTTPEEFKFTKFKTNTYPTTTEPFIIKVSDNTEKTSTDKVIIESIEQLLSQAVGHVDEAVYNVDSTQKVQDMLNSITKKNMSEVQLNSATFASDMIGNVNEDKTTTEALLNAEASDSVLSDSVESLLSQIYSNDNQPSFTTIQQALSTEKYPTTDIKTTIFVSNRKTDKTALNINVAPTEKIILETTNINDGDITEKYDEVYEEQESTTVSIVKEELEKNVEEMDNTKYIPVKTIESEDGKNRTKVENNIQIINFTINSSEDITDKIKPSKFDISLEQKIHAEVNNNTPLIESNTTSTEVYIDFTTASSPNEEPVLKGDSFETTINSITDRIIETSSEKTTEEIKAEETMASYDNTEFVKIETSTKEPEIITDDDSIVILPDESFHKTTELFTELPLSTTDFEIKNKTVTDIPTTIFVIKRTKKPLDFDLTTEYSKVNEDITSLNDITTTFITKKSDIGELNNIQTTEAITENFSELSLTTELIEKEFNIENKTIEEQSTIVLQNIEPSVEILINENLSNFSEGSTTAKTKEKNEDNTDLLKDTQKETTTNMFNITLMENKIPKIDEQLPTRVEIKGSKVEANNNLTKTENLRKDQEKPETNIDETALKPGMQVINDTDKTSEQKLNSTTEALAKNNTSTWTLVPTITRNSSDTVIVQNIPPTVQNFPELIDPPSPVDLTAKPLQGFGLEDSTSRLDTDIYQFSQLCNELAFGFWKTVTRSISSARSVFVSPFGATSLLAMVFLGARGATSGEMNEILRLDDMVTFNPHLIFKNVSESIKPEEPESGVSTSAIIRELFSDRSKGKLLPFYKERARAFYDGYVEEVSFREIGDVIRRRTNLQVKKYTDGKMSEFLKDSSIMVRSPLAGVSVNVFQTDCSQASTKGRDGEMHFVVLPSIRQRRLIPVPAVVYKSGFLAGYEPSLDATAVSLGTKDQVVSTIVVIPGQQGVAAPGDGLARLEKRLVESSFKRGAWPRLLRSLIPRPGLEVQIPRFSHQSIINATVALKKMGLHDLFDVEKADLRGLNGVANELFLSDMLQINSFATCGEQRIGDAHHSEIYPATASKARNSKYLENYESEESLYKTADLLEEPRDYQRAFQDPLHNPSYLALPLPLRPRQARLPEGSTTPRLRFDRPFLYFIRHNPTGLILHMGRFNPRLLP